MKKYLFLLLMLPFTTIEKKLYGMEQQNLNNGNSTPLQSQFESIPSFTVLLNSLPKDQQAETIQEERTVAPIQESFFIFAPNQLQNNVTQKTNPSTKRLRQNNPKTKSNKKKRVSNQNTGLNPESETSSSSSQISVPTNKQNQNTITTNTVQQGTSSNQQFSTSEEEFNKDLALFENPPSRPTIINDYITTPEESPKLLQQIKIFFTKLRYPQHAINYFSNGKNTLLKKMIANRSAKFIEEIFKLILDKINTHEHKKSSLTNLKQLAKDGKQIAENLEKNETVKVLELTIKELKNKLPS